MPSVRQVAPPRPATVRPKGLQGAAACPVHGRNLSRVAVDNVAESRPAVGSWAAPQSPHVGVTLESVGAFYALALPGSPGPILTPSAGQELGDVDAEYTLGLANPRLFGPIDFDAGHLGLRWWQPGGELRGTAAPSLPRQPGGLGLRGLGDSQPYQPAPVAVPRMHRPEAEATAQTSAGRASGQRGRQPFRAATYLPAAPPRQTHAPTLALLEGAPRPWNPLPYTWLKVLRLIDGDVVDAECGIYFTSFADIADPVVVLTGHLRHVFSYAALLRHLMVTPTNPCTTLPMRPDSLFRVEIVATAKALPSA